MSGSALTKSSPDVLPGVTGNQRLAAAAGADGAGPQATVGRVFTVGTLRYTAGGLVVLFIWLLWGDFCSTVFQSIFGSFLPLYLHHLRASNTLIAFLATGVGGVMNLLFLPNISMWTDRHRGRWGRRIPFLFWSTPVAALALVGIGYSSEIGAWLQSTGGPLRAFSVAGLTLAVISVLVVLYTLFLMTTNNVYQFLLRDVVPQEVMAWFLALFRVVGVVAGSLFSWYLFRYIVGRPKLLCLGVGLLYVVSFAVICWGVREGRYPPPPPRPERGAIFGTVQSYLRYFRECLSVGIYRNYIFVFVLLITGQTATAPFMVLFGIKTLRIGVGDYGKILALSTLASGVVYLPMGYLCKHFHPMRVTLASVVLTAVGPAAAFFFVWNRAGWLAYSVATMLPAVGWALGSFAVMMMLFPAEEFGKFSSSLMAIGWGSLALTSYLVGAFMNFFGGNYRMVLLVSLVCYAAAIVPMVQVYRGWKRHGGPDNYIPPLPKAMRRSRLPVVGE